MMKNFKTIIKTMFALFMMLQIVSFTRLYAYSNIDLTRLDAYMSELETSNRSMFSLSITENGIVRYQKSIGYADPLMQKRSNANTRYRIGGISKLFTSVIVLQMVDEKMIQLGTPVARFFPEISIPKNITIKDLLAENINIQDFLPGGAYVGADGRSMPAQLYFQGEPAGTGTKARSDDFYSFTNSNYLLLGLIIEKITGKRYADVVHERVINKANLLNTYDGAVFSAAPDEAVSFGLENEKWETAGKWDLNSLRGSGSIISTPGDMAKLIYTLFSGKLVSESSLNNMVSLCSNKGFDMINIPGNCHTGYGYTGTIDGFVSRVIYIPHDSVAISYSMNADDHYSSILLNTVIDHLYGEP